MLTTLMLDAQAMPCAMLMNGQSLGCLTQPLCLPLSRQGTYLITCFPLPPLDEKYLPRTLCLTLRDGLPAQPIEGAWVGVGEGVLWVRFQLIERLQPPQCASYASDIARFSLHGRNHTATLFYTAGWHLSVEDAQRDRLLLCTPLPGFLGGTVRRISAHSEVDLLVSGRCEEGECALLFVLQKDGYELGMSVLGALSVESGQLFHHEPLDDVMHHVAQTRYDLSEFPFVEQSSDIVPLAEPVLPTRDALVCRAFFEAILLAQYDEAFAFMSASLREGMEVEDLATFFDPFDEVMDVSEEAPHSIWLAAFVERGLYRLRGYQCAMDRHLITDIQEL